MADREFLFDTEPIVAWRFWTIEKDQIPEIDDETSMRSFMERVIASVDAGDAQPLRDLMLPHLAPWGAGSGMSWPHRKRAEASCDRGHDHVPPAGDCECGFWALRDEEQVYQQIAAQNYKTQIVFGRVHMWGKFVECKRGWRAQYAYPAEVFLVGCDDTDYAATLADLYGIPVSNIPMPARVAEILAERKANAKEPSTNFATLINNYMCNFSAPAFSKSPLITWMEDGLTPTVWPKGITPPNEFWDAIDAKVDGKAWVPRPSRRARRAS